MPHFIEIFIPGKIVPKGRPRLDRKRGRLYTPKKTRDYERYVAMMLRAYIMQNNVQRYEGAVCIKIIAVIQTPKRAKWTDPHLTKPDLDNIVKIALDACTLADVWRDDKLVTWIDASKRRTMPDEQPGLALKLWPGS
jgi:Holliday junction resolvase RusA-like endonuclease